MLLAQFINFKPAKEFHEFKIIKTNFLDDMYHSEVADLQLNIYLYLHLHGVVLH
jgi:hypothetical protein